MKPKLICVKHVLLTLPLLCLVAITACSGGGGGAQKSPEQVAAESSAATILDTTIKELGDNAFTTLALGIKSAGVTKALSFLTTCSSGMESSSPCMGGGTSNVTADCTVETGSDGSESHVVSGSIEFDSCGALPLRGSIDFTMRIGPISSSCLVGSPIEAALQNNAANPFSSGDDPVHMDATLNGTLDCDSFELLVSGSTIDICPFVCVLSESESSVFACIADTDCDLIADESDNCPDIYNPSQTDLTDENESGVPNGIGDACEYVACGDGVCDPADGECDIMNYCYRDCDKGLCIGLASEASYCGDGICDPLGGECSGLTGCQKDCPLWGGPAFEGCFPDTWGNGVCEEWENDIYEGQWSEDPYGFSVADCACIFTTGEGSECKSTSECGSGAICRPVTLPPTPADLDYDISYADYYTQVLSTPCACMQCGNGVLDADAGEQCDKSAPSPGNQCGEGISCNYNCECPAPEPTCPDLLPDDGDQSLTCADAEGDGGCSAVGQEFGIGLGCDGASGCCVILPACADYGLDGVGVDLRGELGIVAPCELLGYDACDVSCGYCGAPICPLAFDAGLPSSLYLTCGAAGMLPPGGLACSDVIGGSTCDNPGFSPPDDMSGCCVP